MSKFSYEQQCKQGHLFTPYIKEIWRPPVQGYNGTHGIRDSDSFNLNPPLCMASLG